MDLKRRQLQKYLSLSIGVLGWFLGGIVFGFNVYAISLKKTFNFTQDEVEYIASSGDIGLASQFMAGIVFDKFGSRVSCTISLILTTMGFLLMWIATNYRIFFHSKYWLICIFYFVASAGTLFVFLPSMVVNCKNFDRKHSGKVLGILSMMFGAGPAIYSALYTGLFVQGHIVDAENQNLGGFLIMLAVLSACINIAAIVMLQPLPDITDPETDISEDNCTNEKDNEGSNKPLEINDRTKLVQENNTMPGFIDMTCWQMIQTVQFYYISIICIIIGGLGGSFLNNITTVVKSAGIEAESVPFTIIIPICTSLSRLLGGVIPDFIFQRWPAIPKSSILLFSCTFTIISHIVFIFFNQNVIGLVCSSVLAALAYGAFYIHVNINVLQFFGLRYFGQNSSLALTSHAIGIVLIQKLFGLNYESFSPHGSRYCNGDMCTRGYFVLASVLSVCAMFLNFCLMKIEKDQEFQCKESIDS